MTGSDHRGSQPVSAQDTRDDRPAQADESFGTLLKELAQDTSTLLKQEIALARAELTDKARVAGKGAGMLAGAAVFGLLMMIALTALLIIVLDAGLELWLAALVVTLLWAGVAVVLALAGRSQLKTAIPPTPEQTIETVKEDIQWASHLHPTRSART
ncbi:MAG: phage holin family protein [Kineosporiaceae bacterium]